MRKNRYCWAIVGHEKSQHAVNELALCFNGRRSGIIVTIHIAGFQCSFLIPHLLPIKEKPLKINAFRGFLVAGVGLSPSNSSV